MILPVSISTLLTKLSYASRQNLRVFTFLTLLFPGAEITVSQRLRIFTGQCLSGTGCPGWGYRGRLGTQEGPGGWGGRMEGKGWTQRPREHQRPLWPFCYFACGPRVAMSMCLKEIISHASLGTHRWVVQAHCGTFPRSKVRGAGNREPSMFP